MKRTRPRVADERGFTMIVALGIMLIVSLMTAAAFVAVESDARVVNQDLNGKRAYAAAQAGVQEYLYLLNSNSVNDWWQNCPNDSQSSTRVPGSSPATYYSYAPVVTCTGVSSLIDAAGNLRLEFTGTAGTGGQAATRTIVASFNTDSPLSYLWYTVHETLDPAADASCANDSFYYDQTSQHTIPSECQLNWITGDSVNGPLYTQDQLLIASGQAPSFQSVTSDAPSTNANAVCVNSSCGSATFTSRQTVEGGGKAVPLPTDNSNLQPDAQAHGLTFTGTTNIVLNGSQMTITNCQTSSCGPSTTYSIASEPVIYVSSVTTGSSTCNTTYSPNDVSYTMTSGNAYGPCGDIYVSGTYSSSLTLAADNDIVVTGDLENSTDTNGTTAPTGTATLGLVANQYVRVYHPGTISNGSCTLGSAPNPNVTIDAAILTLQHSFMVDNYECGAVNPQNATAGKLIVHGSIAQEYRGAVGQSNQLGLTGYLKSYNYDSRLATLLPPYMFDLQSTQWTVQRETLCSTAAGTCTSSS